MSPRSPRRPQAPGATPARPLAGRVAVVAGATRGAGRGIARALGEAGAIVYCTGRSVRGEPSPYARPETIDETVEMITAAGGTASPIPRPSQSGCRPLSVIIGEVSPRRSGPTPAVGSRGSRDDSRIIQEREAA